MAQSAVLHSEKGTTGRSLMQAAYALTARLAPAVADRFAAARFLTPRRTPRAASEDEILRSARPLVLRSDKPGASQIAAWVWGHGAPVMLVHGWEGRATQLGAFVGPLVDAGFTAVAFDAPAHGSSPGRRASLRSFVDAMQAVTERFGELDGIIAHSFGGLATLLALAEGQAAKSAVVIAPPSARERLAWLGQVLGAKPERLRAVGSRVADIVGLRVDDVEAPVLASRVSTPGLVIHDRRDREIPYGYGRSVVDAWQHARLFTTDGLGHRRILRDCRVIAESVRFVQEHALQRAQSSDLEAWLDRVMPFHDSAPLSPLFGY